MLPWDHLDSGLDKDWLWEDWQDALAGGEVDDCRWTPCFDCGVCPSMGTEIQVGPTGRPLLPLSPCDSDAGPGGAVSRQPPGPPPPPIVQRLRIRYAKRGRLRFTSHRDVARVFERALRRAEIPMAFSAGFSPHPKLSYAGAAPTGVASEAEYLEIGLAERRDPAEVRAALDAALPPGHRHPRGRRGGAGRGPVARRADRGVALADPAARRSSRRRPGGRPSTCWRMTEAPVQRADQGRLPDRRCPSRDRQRCGSATARPGGDGVPEIGACATLDLVVRHATPAVRPDDVLTALRTAAGLTTPVTPVVTRLAQGLLDDTSPGDAELLIDPLG